MGPYHYPPLDLDAIRARAEAACEGPWRFHDFGYEGEQEPSSIVVHTGKFDHADLCEYESETAIAWMPRWEAQESDNARFIAHAREDVPCLLDLVERLREKVAQPDWWYQDMADLLAERDRAEVALARVRELHRPRTVQVLTGDCSTEECAHEDECPTVPFQQCVECDRIADEVDTYYSERGVSPTTWPCPTFAAIEGTDS